jgi:hypothetical protein
MSPSPPPSALASPPAAAAAPPGSRWESAWLALLLACDLASTPFHLLAFLLTRGRQRRAFRRALEQAAR